jgi:hypothetical protein
MKMPNCLQFSLTTVYRSFETTSGNKLFHSILKNGPHFEMTTKGLNIALQHA